MSAEPQPDLTRKGGAGAGWMLGLLVLVYTSNFIDRTIVGVLGQAIKRDLGLSDLQLGLLGGLAFAVFYTGLGVPVARLAERRSRVTIIAVSTALWSAMTMLCGFAQGYAQLLIFRMGVGVGEAGAAPAAQSLISDRTAPSRRATALAIYSLGIPLGTLLGAAGGGWIARAMDWRAAFVAVGLPGLVLALLVKFTLKEPARETTTSPPPFSAVVKRLLARRSALHLAAAAGLASVAGYGISLFLPAWLQRRHGLDVAEAGLLSGLIASFPAAISLLAGGFIADRWSRRDPRAPALTPAFALMASAPLCILGFLAPDWMSAAWVLTLAALVQTAYLPPVFAAVHALVEPRMRATATALLLLAINLLGLGIGPALVGALSDAFAGGLFDQLSRTGRAYADVCTGGGGSPACHIAGAHGLGRALAVVALFYLWAAAHALMAARRLKTDLAGAEAN